MRIALNQDSAAGLLFIAIGVAGLWLGRSYPTGDALRMGPGYFPHILSWLLVLLGAAVTGKGILLGGERLAAWRVRPAVFICLAFLVFGALIERAGLPAAALGCVIVGALAGRDFRWHEQIALAVGLSAVSAVVFIYALNLPMRLWPA